MDEIKRLTAELERARAETERAHAAAAVAADTAMSALVSHAPVSLAVLNLECRFLKVSSRWTEQFRLAEADVAGRSVYDVLPWSRDQEPEHRRALAGESVVLDIAAPRKDGSVLHYRLELSPWRTPEGRIGGIMALSHDTSDLVRSRQAVRRAEQRLTLALEMFESMVWELSFPDRRLYATGAVSQIYDEMPTFKSFTEDMLQAVHPADRERVGDAWRAHLDHNHPFRIEYRILRRDGAEVWVDCVSVTLRDAEGAPERVIGVIKNITERKHAQLAVAQARESAEAANRAKSEFLANMSHEIRTPLNGVMGVAGALAGTPLSDDQRQMVRLIESSAHTLERLLTDILDLARIEAGRFEIKQEPFDLPDLLNGVAALFEPAAREKGVAFELDMDEGCRGAFVGDAVRLRQVLTNLLSNAVKFTEEGAVRLIASALPCADPGRMRLRVSVRDSGIGFDPRAMGRLFERFQQADGSITRRYGGSGLGLAISKSLAEHMGGRLEADSIPGQGATFTLQLDLPRAAKASSGAPTPSTAPRRFGVTERAPRVLLAEDHPTNRKVVELILGAAGIELTSVENGEEAVKAAAAQDFDLILMDLQMPVMDGLTATRHIRSRERSLGLQPIPIVALTANAMPEHAHASRAAGATEHVTKPVAAQVLLDVVARLAGPSEPVQGEAVHG